ncbi:MAG: hypothetical protein RMJ84_01905 [Sandaracinaceae bacterium]|nr:hypothetical protein [Sandaracinaceae bacterium]
MPKTTILSLALRLLLAGGFGWLLFHLFRFFGIGHWFWPLLAIALMLFFGEAWLRRRRLQAKIKRLERWEAALFDPTERPYAIQEVQGALERARLLGRRMRNEQAHLSVILAELFEASGKAEQACNVLSRIPLDELDPARSAVVRYHKARAQIAAGRLDEAQATIQAHKPPTVPDFDLRIELLRLLLQVEKGQAFSALSALEGLEKQSELEGLEFEIALLRTSALLALGRSNEARQCLEALNSKTLDLLALFGTSKVRDLAQESKSKKSSH